jgi:hypothetical protein
MMPGGAWWVAVDGKETKEAKALNTTRKSWLLLTRARIGPATSTSVEVPLSQIS